MFINRNVSVLMLFEKSACNERIVLNSQRSISMSSGFLWNLIPASVQAFCTIPTKLSTKHVISGLVRIGGASVNIRNTHLPN